MNDLHSITKDKSIALISCSKKKRKWTYRAYDLYSPSVLFRKYVRYAEKYCKDRYILSAKYHIIDKNKIITDYDYTLNFTSEREREVWKYSQ